MAIVALLLFVLGVALISYRDDDKTAWAIVAIYMALVLSSVDMMNHYYGSPNTCECMQMERDNQYLD